MFRVVLAGLMIGSSAFGLYVADLTQGEGLAFHNKNLELLLNSFQGCVNVDAPRLFVKKNQSDAYWLNTLVANHGVSYTVLNSPWDAFSVPDLANKVVGKRFIAVDLAQNFLSVNAAITAAGYWKYIVVGNDSTAIARLQNLGYVFYWDWRAVWPTPESAQSYTYSSLLQYNPNPSRYAISKGSWTEIWPSAVTIPEGLDYNIQQGLFTWCLDSSGVTGLTDYNTTQQYIMNAFPAMTLIYGWWSNEVPDVRAFSSKGHTFFGHGRNLSVFVHYPAPSGQNPLNQKSLPLQITDIANNFYICLSFTQGDNAGWSIKPNREIWETYSTIEPALKYINAFHLLG